MTNSDELFTKSIMKFIKSILLLFLLLIFGCNIISFEEPISTLPEPEVNGEFIDDWTYKVYPNSQDNFDVAEFRLWTPENTTNLKAILILAHSNNSNALGLARSESWQEYANSENLGILAVHLKSFSTTAKHYSDARGGSGDALLLALDSITQRNNIQYINDLPFLMRGYSAGGMFSYHFSAFKPKRLIAFVNIRGSRLEETPSINKNIPGLMLLGENESPIGNQHMKNIVISKRREGGAWSYAIEPNQDHFGNLEPSDALAKTFFSAALIQRLSNDTNQLISIAENSGWLGDNVSKNTFPFNNYPNAVDEASWLIDETFAHQWKNYQFE